MASIKISQLEELLNATKNDYLPIVNNGETKKISVDSLNDILYNSPYPEYVAEISFNTNSNSQWISPTSTNGTIIREVLQSAIDNNERGFKFILRNTSSSSPAILETYMYWSGTKLSQRQAYTTVTYSNTSEKIIRSEFVGSVSNGVISTDGNLWCLMTFDIPYASKGYVDTSVSDASIQLTTIPTATSSRVGKIYQYTGETTDTYKNGYFYQVLSETTTDDAGVETTTYSWTPVEVQENKGGSNNIGVVYMETSQNLDGDENFAPTLRTDLNNALTDYYANNDGKNPVLIIRGTSNSATYVFVPTNSSTFISISGNLSAGYIERRIACTFQYVDGVKNVKSVNYYFKRRNILFEDNTDSFTPTSNYHPATKKYVDDQIKASITTVLEADY